MNWSSVLYTPCRLIPSSMPTNFHNTVIPKVKNTDKFCSFLCMYVLCIQLLYIYFLQGSIALGILHNYKKVKLMCKSYFHYLHWPSQMSYWVNCLLTGVIDTLIQISSIWLKFNTDHTHTHNRLNSVVYRTIYITFNNTYLHIKIRIKFVN